MQHEWGKLRTIYKSFGRKNWKHDITLETCGNNHIVLARVNFSKYGSQTNFGVPIQYVIS
jgi:hypothetical protein